MSRYDGLKYWKLVKARRDWRCGRCGRDIAKGDLYWTEKIDFVNPGPGMHYRRCCVRCHSMQEELTVE